MRHSAQYTLVAVYIIYTSIFMILVPSGKWFQNNLLVSIMLSHYSCMIQCTHDAHLPTSSNFKSGPWPLFTFNFAQLWSQDLLFLSLLLWFRGTTGLYFRYDDQQAVNRPRPCQEVTLSWLQCTYDKNCASERLLWFWLSICIYVTLHVFTHDTCLL